MRAETCAVTGLRQRRQNSYRNSFFFILRFCQEQIKFKLKPPGVGQALPRLRFCTMLPHPGRSLI